jgi:hypothetical protein
MADLSGTVHSPSDGRWWCKDWWDQTPTGIGWCVTAYSNGRITVHSEANAEHVPHLLAAIAEAQAWLEEVRRG